MEATAKLKAIRMTDFKGVMGTNEIKIGRKTLISGRNGSGKTTIQDAHLWLWMDKDSSLRSNPNIRPDDGRECIPTVEEEWEINGAIVTVAKMQKKKASKPDANGISKVALTNTYSINSVPKTERDFKKDLSERGFDFEKFLELSHLDVFVGQKPADMRKELFAMVKTKTDLEVAEITEGCGDVALLLKSYKADEIEAMNKASKKKADEQLAAIPNQIIGLEKAKIDIDVAELELQRNALNEQIAEAERKLNDGMSSIKESDKLANEVQFLKQKASDFKIAANKSISDQRANLRTKISDAEMRKRILEGDLRNTKSNLEQAERDISFNEKMLKKAQDDYAECVNREFDETKLHEIEAEQFDESCLICPTCGQSLPAEQQSNMRERFDKSKKERIEQQKRAKEVFEIEIGIMLDKITADGNQANESLKATKQGKSDLQAMISMSQKEIKTVSEEIDRLNAELAKLPQEIDLSEYESYQDIIKQVTEKESALQEMTSSSAAFRETMEKELKIKRRELSDVTAEIAKSENNIRIDEQIADLEERRRDYAQAKADAEKILYQLSLVSRAKNELLTEEINSHFGRVRFKLYDYQKNGEYKEVCIPEVFDGKEWKNMFESANTSLAMKGKIKIIDGLQRFYGQNLPVFVDYASEFDTDSIRGIKTGCQMVYLKVMDETFNIMEI